MEGLLGRQKKPPPLVDDDEGQGIYNDGDETTDEVESESVASNNGEQHKFIVP